MTIGHIKRAVLPTWLLLCWVSVQCNKFPLCVPICMHVHVCASRHVFVCTCKPEDFTGYCLSVILLATYDNRVSYWDLFLPD